MLGDNIKIKFGKTAWIITERATGKELANVIRYGIGEAGFSKLFNPIKVNGVNLLPPEARLVSKAYQQTIPLPKGKRGKVITDISQLMGEPTLVTDPALLRGYGIPKAKQKAMFDAQELYLTHGGKGIIPAFKETITLAEGEFFSTPTLVKTGKAGARKSRMGFGKEQEYASFLDLLSPKGRANIEFYPSPKQVIIERARLKKGKIEVPDIGSTEIEVVRKVPKEGTELAIQKRFRTILEGEPVEIAFVKEVPRKVDLKRAKMMEGRAKKSKTRKDESDLKDFLKEQEGRKVRPRKDKKLFRTPQRPVFRDLPRDVGRIMERDLPREILRDIPRTPDRDIPRTPERDITREPPRTPARVPPYVPARQPPRRPPRMPPRRPPTQPPKAPPIIRRGRRPIKIKEKLFPSYDVEIKSKGKFRKITKKPVSYQDSKDMRAFILDESTARTGRILPRKVKPSPLQVDIPRGYSQRTIKKFRAFEQRKGVRRPLKKTIIERGGKGGYLIDTMGEKRGLSYAKLVKQRRRKQPQKIMMSDLNLPRNLRSSRPQRRVVSKRKSSGVAGLDFA